MNINMLEYLAAIEQYGSLSEAARHLYVSEPYFEAKTVSLMVHKDAIPKAIAKKIGLK